MKILWLDLNSSYSHSSLALPSIHAQCANDDYEWDVYRTTININIGTVIKDICDRKPEVLLATAWLFTHERLHAIVSRMKQLLPEMIVAYGGPEFLGGNEEYLRQNKYVDLVFRGEGEESVLSWLEKINDKNAWKNIPGTCFIDQNGDYFDGGMARVKDMASLRFPEESRFFCKDRAFVQLETARGCLNTCAFCVSGEDKPVRTLPLDTIRKRLDYFIENNIKSIRLLDRTFNGQSRRAKEMLDMFEEYSGRLNFHLEVHPGMLSDQVRGQLKEMSNDVLHLEAGIQSLNQDVLTLSTRLGSLEDSLDGLKFLCSLDNMEVHTDLIAGLPGYSYEMLYQDVIKLAELNAGEIQLELLKLLPGTKMRRESDKLGLKYSPLPPYEVLCSDRMSVADLMKSRKLSRILDFYYNNEVWQTLFRDFIIRDHSFLSDFMDYISDDILEQPLSLEKRGLILFEYCKLYKPEFLPEVKIAWILGGLSVSKEPAQDMKAFLEETDSLKVISGEKTKMMRFYSLDNYVFGFDRAIQRQKPIFFATIK